MFVLGLETNKEWKHEIKIDKRDDQFKRADELRDEGHRISLTFRHIATYRRRSDGRLFGQGARYDSEEALNAAVENGVECVDDAEAMLKAFSAENREEDFDWEKHYGQGNYYYYFLKNTFVENGFFFLIFLFL